MEFAPIICLNAGILRKPTFIALLTLTFVTSCASVPDVETTAAAPVEQADELEVKEPEPPARPFELQTLYSLLVADIAAQRNRYDVALRNYLRQAAKTEDAGIARHATALAELLRAEAVALRASELWAKAAPGDSDALRSAAIHQARARDLDRAMAHMVGAMELGGSTQFTQLAGSASNLTHSRKQEVLTQMQGLIERHPKNSDLWLGVATLEDSLGNTDAALLSVRESLKLDEHAANRGRVSALITESQLLEKLNRSDEAISGIKKALAKDEDNKRLHLQYARLLTRSDMPRAEQEFERLVAKHPSDFELKFTLALVYRENQKLAEAKDLLDTLLELDPENASVHYYLGLVQEDRELIDEALVHYANVTPGRVFIPAQARYAQLLSERDQLDDAMTHLDDLAVKYPAQAVDLKLLSANTLTSHGELDRSYDLLTESLESNPDNTELLYARSMLSEKRKDLNGAESDLRQLLSVEPDNAAALNALGYSLTVNTKRFDEALVLIQKAITLKPNDPAIIDSLGWVHFKRGDLDEALVHLQKAYQMFPDPEVAAHLGEALWVAGRQDQAKEIWRKAIEAEPDNQFMKDIIERFGQP
ncbi:MAG: tetratricopeptide repeat protein [Pseudomonadales bacterium]